MVARRVALLAGLLLAGLCVSATAQPIATDPRVAAAWSWPGHGSRRSAPTRGSRECRRP